MRRRQIFRKRNIEAVLSGARHGGGDIRTVMYSSHVSHMTFIDEDIYQNRRRWVVGVESPTIDVSVRDAVK